MICRCFLAFYGLSLEFFDNDLWCTKFLILMKSNLSISFFLYVYIFCVRFKKSLPNTMSWKFMLMFSSESFSFNPYIRDHQSIFSQHFYMVYCRSPVSFFCIWLSSCLSAIVEKTILSSVNCLDTLVMCQLNVYVRVFFWTLNFI